MFDDFFERRVIAALRSNGAHDARAREAIMTHVRALPPAERPVRPPRGLAHRAARHSIVGVALAAGIGSMATLPTLLAGTRGSVPAALATAVIGDSVSSTLRDTLRIVRLIFDDPTARQVDAVGDFNGWRAGTTPLHRDAATRVWTATLALRDGEHRYAFVVDGVRWAVDRSAPRARLRDGRAYSMLTVARSAN